MQAADYRKRIGRIERANSSVSGEVVTDQLYIGDDGQIQSQPLTWDGEPVYSPSTIAEGLFPSEAFTQQRGQTGMSDSELFGSGDPLERFGAIIGECRHDI